MPKRSVDNLGTGTRGHGLVSANPADVSPDTSAAGTSDTSTATGNDNKPPESPKQPPASGGKNRVKCEALKGGKITVGKGKIVDVDENGIFEVEEKEAERLLTIPGYEEVK
jgi:hypothetical protein